MRKTVLVLGAVLGLVLVLWIVAGAVVWSRNSFSAPSLPARKPLPKDNAYTVYTGAVRDIKSPKEVTAAFNSTAPSAGEIARLTRENASVMTAVRAARTRPSVVTDLEPGVNFVGAIDFPNVTRLLMLETRARAARSASDALEPMLDGVRFSEGVIRGGAMLHLLTGYMAYTPIFQAFPDVVGRLPAETCRKGADELRKLLGEQAPLDELVKNEHAVRFRQLTSTFPAPGSVFQFRLPWDRRDFALKPKAPAVDGLNRYFEAWEAQTERPITQVTAPAAPAGLEGILSDDSMGPEEMDKRFLQFHWRAARLRILYTALKLEEFRKQKGRYPSELGELGADSLFRDPFSDGMLAYRREGGSYSLYSAGPNGKDDGGAPVNEARLSREQVGDLPLVPTFGRR